MTPGADFRYASCTWGGDLPIEMSGEFAMERNSDKTMFDARIGTFVMTAHYVSSSEQSAIAKENEKSSNEGEVLFRFTCSFRFFYEA